MRRYSAVRDFFEEVASGVKIMSIVVISVMVVVIGFFIIGFLIATPFHGVQFETTVPQDSTFKIDVNNPVSVELLDEIMEHQRKINSIVKQLKEREEK